MVVLDPIDKLWAFLNTRVGIPWSSDFRAIGSVKNACLGAVAGYNGFVGRVCFMHVAIDDPAAIDRTFVRTIFDFPFRQCNLKEILASVSAENLKSLSICSRVGFSTALLFEKSGLKGEDMFLLRMKRDECRYFNGKQE